MTVAAFAAAALDNDIAAGLIYVAAVAATAWIPGTRSTLLVATTACALALLGYVVTPPGSGWWTVVANALLGCFAIGVVSAVVWHYKRLGAHRDLADERAASQEEQFRQSIESNPAGMLLVDRQGRIVLVNLEAERLLGYARHALVGQPVESLLPTLERGNHARQRAAFLAEAAPRRMASGREVHAVHKDGHELTVEVGLARIDTGEGAFVVATLIDVGERARASQAQEAINLSRRLLDADEAQRKRMAREIHDALGQGLTALKLEIGWLAAHLPEEPAHLHEHAIAMEELAASTIDDVRRLVSELRPSILDDQGLLPAIRWQVSDFEKRSDLRCALRLPDEMIGWSEERCTVAFRVLQESLTNVLRHAQARNVAVTLWPRREGGAVLEVRDDGRGIGETEGVRTGAFGLLGMRERAFLHDGTLTVVGVPGVGTTVTLRMPCENASPPGRSTRSPRRDAAERNAAKAGG